MKKTAKKTTTTKTAVKTAKTVTSNLTLVNLNKSVNALDNGIKGLRQTMLETINSSITGKPEKLSEITNAISVNISGHSYSVLKEKHKSHKALPLIHRVANFVNSWCELKAGKLVLLDENKKLAGKKGKDGKGGAAGKGGAKTGKHLFDTLMAEINAKKFSKKSDKIEALGYAGALAGLMGWK
jgi:hypothetical protein